MYLGNMNRIDMRFAEQIAREEWAIYEEEQQHAIESKTNRRSGTLENFHGNRKYRVVRNGFVVTASNTHPDYQRFLDMSKDRIRNRQVSVFGDRNVLVRRKSRAQIHNRIIFGRLNPITFRLMHDLKVIVKEEVRSIFPK